ncbi:MAG TPA: hypothetical protein VGM82_18930 [Gemmatimonadaceae bacterium]|jgi:hypothetical protein
MLRVPLLSHRGNPLTIELDGSTGAFPAVDAGQSVLLVRQRGDDAIVAAPLGPRAWFSSSSRAGGVRSPITPDIESLADRIVGWENVFYQGQRIACYRSAVLLVLCSSEIRAQVIAAIRAAKSVGIL